MILSASNIGWDSSLDDEIYREMHSAGFRGLEIAPTRVFPEKPYSYIDGAEIFAAEIKRKYDFSIASLQSIWFGRTENMFESPLSREVLSEYTKKAILFANVCKCKNLVFGSPKNRKMEDGASYRDAVDFFRNLGQFAHENNTVVSMEPNPVIYGTNFINTTGEAIAIVKEVNSPGFKVNMDLGTVIYNREPLDKILDDLDLINHIHISEPYLKPVEKRELHLDLAKALRERKYSGAVSIEMAKPDRPEILKNIIRYVAGVFG